MMAKCIELDMQCASICYAAAQQMGMGSPYAKDICKICAEVCMVVQKSAGKCLR